jgi:hypothetical protein
MTSTSVPNHGNAAGIVVLAQEMTSWNETEANKIFDKWLSVRRINSGTFVQKIIPSSEM